MIDKKDFSDRIAAAIRNGRGRIGFPISSAESLERATQVAEALPQLFQE